MMIARNGRMAASAFKQQIRRPTMAIGCQAFQPWMTCRIVLGTTTDHAVRPRRRLEIAIDGLNNGVPRVAPLGSHATAHWPLSSMQGGSGLSRTSVHPPAHRPLDTEASTTSAINDQPASKQPIEFGLPQSERDVMSKAMAKIRFLLRDEDLENVKPFREEHVTAPADGPTMYLVQDLERACLRRWGSEKEFRREQLRREIRRRRQELRRINQSNLNPFGVGSQIPFVGIDKHRVETMIVRNVDGTPAGRESEQLLGDLPWDPALGNLPELKDTSVGKRAVHTAIATNFVVLVSKLGAFIYTGSASVLSEAVHSIADLGNQCLLAVGIEQSQKEADALHPYGYATDRYVWSLISGVGIFFLGCGVSMYHGIAGLIQPHDIEHFQVGLSVLGLAFVVESYSLWVAIEECRHEAKKAGMTFQQYVFEGSDAMNVAVLMEDSVAVVGCGIAGAALYASHVTGNTMWDSLGSITIASLLGIVAVVLIQKNRDLLVGYAVPPKRVSRVIDILERDPSVFSVHDVKAIVIGPDRGRFKAEINFDSEVLAKLCMQRCKDKLEQIRNQEKPSEVDKFLLDYSREFVATMGDEVDRLEGIIRRELPEIRHVDLEIL